MNGEGMQDVLIGYTGFVGSALARQHRFGLQCNSKNTAKLKSQCFGTVICAAAPGSMVAANRAPDRDAKIINRLMSTLKSIRSERFVLISTIAVLDQPDAKYDETARFFERELAYGRNRRELESFCTTQFPNCLIVRLPALYGEGLRKNFLFDILNPVPSMLDATARDRLNEDLPATISEGISSHFHWHEAIGMYVLDRLQLAADPRRTEFETALAACNMSALQFTNPESTFQYYSLNRLWEDVRLALEANIPLAHMATEPLKAAEVYHHLTGKRLSENSARVHREDFRTRHEDIFGGQDGYIQTRAEVLTEIGRWMDRERTR